jgi:serine/threonine protein kinase
MRAFIDFLKGVLRINKDLRWTPNMAKEHPFITRALFEGNFEPEREVERISSSNETGDDTMSELSNSSKSSKDYNKVGSCPSKILYPQTASIPQYLQSNSSSFIQQPSQLSGGITSGNQFVFHNFNQQVQSTRPPILSIPDEYFKGFMFGRLDQILSMTREQLFQFIYE